MDGKGYLRFTKIEKLNYDLNNAFLIANNKDFFDPEIILGNDSKNADWWMLGLFLYKILFKIDPFFNSKIALYGKIIFPETIEISEDAKDIILKLLEKDPIKRLGSHGGIEEIKKHPFFKL